MALPTALPSTTDLVRQIHPGPPAQAGGTWPSRPPSWWPCSLSLLFLATLLVDVLRQGLERPLRPGLVGGDQPPRR